MFVDYYPGKTLLHRLDVRAKLAAFTALMVLLFFFTNPLYNLFLALFGIFLLFYLGLPTHKISSILKPIAPILLLILLITAFSYPAEDFAIPAAKVVFYKKDWFELSSGGVLYGITLVLRIFSMVIFSSILTCSTPMDHFLQLMKISRLPANISFLIITGIRFVPTMQKKVEMVFNAQKVRGASFDEKGLVNRIKAYIPIMVPLLVQSLYMSDRLAVAMLNRGYGAAARQTSLEEIRMAGTDYIFIILSLAVVVMGIYLRVQGIGRL